MSQLRKQLSALTGISDSAAGRLLAQNNGSIARAADAHFAADPQLVSIFEKYKESDSQIGVDGTLAYLEDLGLQPEDLRSLTVAYLLGSSQMGQFERDKFMAYWRGALSGPASLAAMRQVVEERHQAIMADPAEFACMYAYCFDFIRSSDRRIRSIAAADATAYWRLLFADRTAENTRLEQWYEFLARRERPVSRDLWLMWLKFLQDVVAPDPERLAGYDEMSSWPSVIDEYVEWLAENGYRPAISAEPGF